MLIDQFAANAEEQPMSTLCRLCRIYPAIENSHVISQLIFRAVKSDSPTGFFRNPNVPNKREQDGDKLDLCCNQCEQRFGNAENDFGRHVFDSIHNRDCDEFSYGPWLHYFMTSLAWRTLVLDLPGLEADQANPRRTIAELTRVCECMRLYLLGASHQAENIRNHAVLFARGVEVSADLAAIGANVMIRRSIFGYTLIDQGHGYAAILHNLAGFCCVTIVKGNPRETWKGTKISPLGGHIKPPQIVNSWFMYHLFGMLIDAKRGLVTMSDRQTQKIRDAMRQNSNTSAMRFVEWDQRLFAEGG